MWARMLPSRSKAVAVMSLVISAATLAGCGTNSTSPSPTTANLKPAATVTIPKNNLPASHDNDAGHARIPDSTPDNDSDPNPPS
jgi:outer membrane PBP1 activator LpoA protein